MIRPPTPASTMRCAARWAQTKGPVRLSAITILGEHLDGFGRAHEVGHVQPRHDGAASELPHLTRGALGPVAIAVPGDADVEAVAREPHRRRLADARVGTRDDRPLRHGEPVPGGSGNTLRG
jgi:hypothetical protein